MLEDEASLIRRNININTICTHKSTCTYQIVNECSKYVTFTNYCIYKHTRTKYSYGDNAGERNRALRPPGDQLTHCTYSQNEHSDTVTCEIFFQVTLTCIKLYIQHTVPAIPHTRVYGALVANTHTHTSSGLNVEYNARILVSVVYMVDLVHSL